MNVENESILTAEELSKEMKVPARTIWRLLRSHALKGFKVGREWRIRKADWEDYISSQGRGRPLGQAR